MNFNFKAALVLYSSLLTVTMMKYDQYFIITIINFNVCF